MEPRLVPSATLYEAEDATLGGFETTQYGTYPEVENDFPGYTGTGYVNLSYSHYSTITFDVQAGQDGPALLLFRYAVGDGAANLENRPMRLLVNDQTITNALPFLRTAPGNAGWSTWGTVSADVDLHAGINQVELQATDFYNPHLDNLRVADAQPPVLAGQTLPAAPAHSLTDLQPGMASRDAGSTGTASATCNVLATPDRTDVLVFHATVGGDAASWESRPMALSVNGNIPSKSLPLPASAGSNQVELLASQLPRLSPDDWTASF